MFTVLLLGACVGLVLGMTGAGGSIIAVPLLVAFLGLPMTEAAPLALLAVCAAAAVGALNGWRAGHLDLAAAVPLLAGGILLAPAGVMAAHRVPTHVLTGMFALVLAYLAVGTLVRPRAPDPSAHHDADRGTLAASAGRAPRLAVIGALAGFLSGLLGIGGGFVIVPGLRRFTAFDMQRSVATSLMVIAVVSAVGLGSAAAQGALVLDHVALSFIAGSGIGMLAARSVARRCSDVVLQRVFAVMLILASGRMALAAIG